MRHVALGAFAWVMLVHNDLLVPFGAGRIGLVAPDTVAEVKDLEFDVRIICVGLARAMTPFAGERFVLVFGEFLDDVRVAFIARFTTSVGDWTGSQFA